MNNNCRPCIINLRTMDNEQEAVKNSIFNHHFGSLRGHWKQVAFLLMCYDVIAVNLSYFLALWLRFDCRFNSISPEYITSWQRFIPIYSIFCLFIAKFAAVEPDKLILS